MPREDLSKLDSDAIEMREFNGPAEPQGLWDSSETGRAKTRPNGGLVGSDGTRSLTGPTSPDSLDPFDCREPGRCAVVVASRLNPIGFDGGDIPSIAGVERRSQLFLTDGVRASIGTIVAEAQHIQGSIVLGHRR